MSTVLQVDWGSVPDWVSGVGSLGAITIALWVALGEARTRRQRDEDEERRPARLVVVGEPVFWSSEGDGGRVDQVIVGVKNFGEGPIHDLELGIESDDRDDAIWQMQSFLGPGEATEFIVKIPTSENGEELDEVSVNAPELWFVDPLGRRWSRRTDQIEPERVHNHVSHSLPEPYRQEILRNIKADRRRHRRKS